LVIANDGWHPFPQPKDTVLLTSLSKGLFEPLNSYVTNAVFRHNCGSACKFCLFLFCKATVEDLFINEKAKYHKFLLFVAVQSEQQIFLEIYNGIDR